MARSMVIWHEERGYMTRSAVIWQKVLLYGMWSQVIWQGERCNDFNGQFLVVSF